MVTAGTGPGQGWGQWQDRAGPVLHSLQRRSLQPQHSRDGDKELSLHANGEKRTKLRPELILLLSKRTGRRVGWELEPWVHPQTLPPLQPHRSPPLCSELKVCSLYREKLGLPREDGAETLLPPCQKTKGIFFFQLFLQGLDPPQLH